MSALSTDFVFINIWKIWNESTIASFREATHVPQWRHNVSDRKSYTELQTPENHQVHQQILAPTINHSTKYM